MPVARPNQPQARARGLVHLQTRMQVELPTQTTSDAQRKRLSMRKRVERWGNHEAAQMRNILEMQRQMLETKGRDMPTRGESSVDIASITRA